MTVSAPAISRPEPAPLTAFPHAEPAGLADFLEALPCIAFIEQRGQILACNRIAALLTGIDCTAVLAADEVFLGAHPFQPSRMGAGLHLAEWPDPVRFDCMLLRGNRRPLAIHGAAGHLADDNSGRRLVVALEGSRAQADATPQGSFLGDVLDAAPEAMAITSNGRVLHVNREFTRLFGYAAELCEGQEIDSLLAPTAANREMETILHLIAANGSASLDTVRHMHNGRAIDVSILVGLVPLPSGDHGLFYTFRDIRPQKEAEALLHFRAMHDALTELPNRACFLDRLRAALQRLRRMPDRRFAIMFLDLDGFKAANDALGHRAGDALLCEIADRLRQSVRPQDTVARLGGDEFALLLDDSDSVDDISMIAFRIQDAVQRPLELEAGDAAVSASIGIKLVSDSHAQPEELLHHADLAMYQAKAAGKARHEIFDTNMALPMLLRKVS